MMRLRLFPMFAILALVALANLGADAMAQTPSARFCAGELDQGRYPPGCPRPSNHGNARPPAQENHPPSRQHPPLAQRQPAPPGPPAQRQTVVLAPRGGDATSLEQALEMVSNQGTIQIRPGTYAPTGGPPQPIRRSVRLVGVVVDGQRPILDRRSAGLTVADYASEVTIENLEIVSSDHPAISFMGRVRFQIRSSHIVAETATGSAPGTIAVGVAGEAIITDSTIESTRGGSAVATYGGTVVVERSILRGYQSGLWADWPARVSVTNSTIIAATGNALYANQISSVALTGSRIEAPANQKALHLFRVGRVTVRNNDFGATNAQNWIEIEGNYSAGDIQGNTNRSHQPLVAPVSARYIFVVNRCSFPLTVRILYYHSRDPLATAVLQALYYSNGQGGAALLLNSGQTINSGYQATSDLFYYSVTGGPNGTWTGSNYEMKRYGSEMLPFAPYRAALNTTGSWEIGFC